MIDARRVASDHNLADVRVLRDVGEDALVNLHGLWFRIDQEGPAQGATATAGDVRAKARGNQPNAFICGISSVRNILCYISHIYIIFHSNSMFNSVLDFIFIHFTRIILIELSEPGTAHSDSARWLLGPVASHVTAVRHPAMACCACPTLALALKPCAKAKLISTSYASRSSGGCRMAAWIGCGICSSEGLGSSNSLFAQSQAHKWIQRDQNHVKRDIILHYPII